MNLLPGVDLQPLLAHQPLTDEPVAQGQHLQRTLHARPQGASCSIKGRAQPLHLQLPLDGLVPTPRDVEAVIGLTSLDLPSTRMLVSCPQSFSIDQLDGGSIVQVDVPQVPPSPSFQRELPISTHLLQRLVAGSAWIGSQQHAPV